MELNLSYNFDDNIKLNRTQEYENELDRRVAGLIQILEKESSLKSKSPEKPKALPSAKNQASFGIQAYTLGSDFFGPVEGLFEPRVPEAKQKRRQMKRTKRESSSRSKSPVTRSQSGSNN